MRRTLECEATVLPDGHLAVPDDVSAQLAASGAARVHLRIEVGQPVADERDGWQILRDLHKTGGEGQSDRTAEDHDRIAYGR